MKKIAQFQLSRLHVSSHIDFHRSILLAARDATFTNALWNELLGEYTTEINLLDDVVRRPQASIYTTDVQNADALRDSTLKQLFLLIDAAANSSVAAERLAGQKLQIIVKPYRRDGSDQLTDETEDIRGMLRALGTDAAVDWADTLQLGGVIQRLKQQNNAFADIYRTRALDKETQPGAGLNTKEQRKVVDDIYEQIVIMANSVLVSAAAGIETGFDLVALNTFIDTVNADIDQYKMVLANQAKKANKEEEGI